MASDQRGIKLLDGSNMNSTVHFTAFLTSDICLYSVCVCQIDSVIFTLVNNENYYSDVSSELCKLFTA